MLTSCLQQYLTACSQVSHGEIAMVVPYSSTIRVCGGPPIFCFGIANLFLVCTKNASKLGMYQCFTYKIVTLKFELQVHVTAAKILHFFLLTAYSLSHISIIEYFCNSIIFSAKAKFKKKNVGALF